MKVLVRGAWDWFDRFYARFAKILLLFCLLTATGGVIIGTTATIQAATATQGTRVIVECLKLHGKAMTETNDAVRDATVARDAAVGEFNATLQAEGAAFLALVAALSQPSPDQAVFKPLLQTLSETLASRAEANRKVISKQALLDEARAKHPVPPPPSEFCGLEE